MVAAYRAYDFHLIYQKVHNFCVVDLGGCYLDVTKDRLYTTAVASPARRSAQTAMYHVAEAMVRWLAPILSFTAEEVWGYLPGPRAASVFHATWHPLPDVPASAIDWAALIAVRADVQRELERLREVGQIGAPLQARVELLCTPENLAVYSALGEELRFLLITSEARVGALSAGAAAPEGAVAAASRAGVWIRALPIEAPKCVRCWHLRVDVGQEARAPRALPALRLERRRAGRDAGVRLSLGGTAAATGASRPAAMRSGWRWLPLAVGVVLADQLSKGWIERAFALYDSVPVLPVLDLTRLHNPGAAFSFLAGAGGWQRWAFTALALAVSTGIMVWLRGIPARAQAALAAGLALILGGALGNVLDRIEHGYVVDFIHVHWGQAYFPAFNIADAAISVGAGLLLLDAFLEWRRERTRA